MKRNNGSFKAQNGILANVDQLIKLGFDKVQISTILAGSNFSSTDILKSVTAVCADLISNGKSPQQITVHVQPGVKDGNRLRVVASAYLKRQVSGPSNTQSPNNP